MPDAVVTRAAQKFDATFRQSNTPLTVDEMRDALGHYDIILPTLRDEFSAAVFDGVTPVKTRLLANFGVGFNHIDVQAARRAGIAVTNTPGAVTDATADIAMTLLLMSARRAGEGERMVRADRWAGWHPTQMLGHHVSGKRLGVVGMGRIGQAIARRCHFGFGMSVGYVARSDKALDHPATRFPDITALAAEVDFVVIAVPGGPATHHLVDAAVFAAMQRHAHLINISRGDVVDETALIGALESGQIGGAGLDVYEFEPRVPAGLRMREDVVLLPHLGTATAEVRTAMGLMALDNIDAFHDGKPLPNPV
jgi:lactate dehydrogenase-like 2-hydroxyacid dehydrogenase